MEDRGKPFTNARHMSGDDTSTQVRVGLFILIGLSIVAAMVVYFGRLGEGFSDYYTVRVEFSNGSGLLRGCEVLLAGAKVGRMTNEPTILPDLRGVYVDLRILESVQIPVGSRFAIGSSGLLGDKFIEITPAPESSEFIQPGAVIRGAENGAGIAAVANDASQLIADLKTTVNNINGVVVKLDQSVLSKDELAKVRQTIGNVETATARISDASANIADASRKIDALLLKADGAVHSGAEAMATAKSAAEEARKVLLSIGKLVEQARTGQGLLGTLVGNRELADNVKALVLNLRRHGILWYKDSPPPAAGQDTTR